MIAKSERFELRLDAETLERIDKWRNERSESLSRSEAVRQLVEAGLGRPEDDKRLFQLARFNVLVAAKTADPAVKLFPDSYIYAWDECVYPLFNESAHLHEPFAEQFKVPKAMVEELSKYLDDRWLAEDVPSFYQLESHYDVRSGHSEWGRFKLIATCRYMFLHKLFDKTFWDALLRGSDHPSEAKGITRKFDAAKDVYFG
ncbi:CopG family transcriptional regulator [Myxococcus sp. CA040A]|uniref:ribbon-helix-helix domain-containing protein n=1 Tax=Myxococcus sp. CA040A TaxID=2741738 RepID=UPI00157A7359|nr:CopG family transcriptional regulator [Myxococcus sp. CA040A]NTX08012.1 ribbon-helix-helix protein, CopG family [Myxococcus sp. CA040A]